MTVLAIIKFVLIIVAILTAGVGILFIKTRLKKGDKAISQNKKLKKQKRSNAKIQRKRQEIEKDKIETNENINVADSDKLSDAYNEQLQNMPEPKRSRE